MAQRTQVILEDDIDGGEAVETIQFGLDGVTYEIDLNEENAARMRDAFASWVGHGRRVSGRKQRSDAGTSTRRKDLDQVREWARANGYEVSERGRVAAKILNAYDQAAK